MFQIMIENSLIFRVQMYYNAVSTQDWHYGEEARKEIISKNIYA